jgi:hypothetical protein
MPNGVWCLIMATMAPADTHAHLWPREGIPLLAELVEELLAPTRQTGVLDGYSLESCRRFLSLPRYASLPVVAEQTALLAADIRAAAPRVADGEDLRLLQALLRLSDERAQSGEPLNDLPITTRMEELATKLHRNDRALKDRGLHRSLLAHVAFYLYVRAMGVQETGTAKRMGGYRHVASTYHLTITADEPAKRVAIYSHTVEIMGPGQRVYVIGRRLRGAREQSFELISSESDEHVWLRDVPLDANEPAGPRLAFVYFGRVLAVGQQETLRFREVTIDDPKRGSATMTSINVEHQLRFEIDAPRSVIPSYRLVQWDGRDELAREVAPPQQVVRDNDTPIVQSIDAVLGHRYELAWPA